MATLTEIDAELAKRQPTIAQINAELSKRGVEIPETQEPSDGFSFSEMVKNAPQSAISLLEGILSPVYRPLETSEGLKDVALGATEKVEQKIHGMMPDEYWDSPLYKAAQKVSNLLADVGLSVERLPDNKEDMTYKHAQSADQVVQYFADRYGSVDKALKTLEEDPFGAMADVVGAAGGGAMAVNKASSLARKGLGKIDEVGLYEEAAKFSTVKFDKRQRRDMADNLLEEKIVLSDEGLDRIDAIISFTHEEINKIISVADAGDVKIPKVAVLKDIEKLKKSVTGQLEGAKDRAIVDKIVDDFLKEIEFTGEDVFTLAKLQEFKKKSYKKVGKWSKDRSNVDQMKDRVFKTISLAGRDIIENIVPESHALNARQGRLIEAKKPVSQSASRIDNLNKIGLDALIKPGVGELISSSLGLHGVGTAAGLIAHIIGRPKQKGAIAQKLRELRKSKNPIPDDKIIEAFLVAYPQMFEKVRSDKN